MLRDHLVKCHSVNANEARVKELEEIGKRLDERLNGLNGLEGKLGAGRVDVHRCPWCSYELICAPQSSDEAQSDMRLHQRDCCPQAIKEAAEGNWKGEVERLEKEAKLLHAELSQARGALEWIRNQTHHAAHFLDTHPSKK